jgi:hypothetical protein
VHGIPAAKSHRNILIRLSLCFFLKISIKKYMISILKKSEIMDSNEVNYAKMTGILVSWDIVHKGQNVISRIRICLAFLKLQTLDPADGLSDGGHFMVSSL